MFRLRIDMSPILSGKTTVIKVDYPLTVDFTVAGITFPSDAQIQGEIRDRAGYISLDCQLKVSYETVCDRCLLPLQRTISIPFQKTVAEKATLQNRELEDSDDYVVIEDRTLDLDPLLSEALLLQLPSKHLCKEDCLGLCYKCGKDLNEGPCDCKEEESDPLWDSIRKKLSAQSNDGGN